MTFSNTLSRLRLPIIGAPLFLISDPDLVVAQCKAGIIGSFPALNAREDPGERPLLDVWLQDITERLDAHNQAHPDSPAAPFAVNQIVHRSNTRMERDLEICAKWKVPIWITSMGARPEVNDIAHEIGTTVLHDVTNLTYARKAIAKGADGLIALCAGAGGHTGYQSPFALAAEIRSFFDGPLGLAGAISTGPALLAARALGADFAYIGTRFIATKEANADQAYKDMIVDSKAGDIVYSNLFTGVHGNYLAPSIANAGLDPNDLPESDPSAMNFGSGGNQKSKAWKDIWGCGQGIGAIKSRMSTADYVDQLVAEYESAIGALQNRKAFEYS